MQLTFYSNLPIPMAEDSTIFHEIVIELVSNPSPNHWAKVLRSYRSSFTPQLNSYVQELKSQATNDRIMADRLGEIEDFCFPFICENCYFFFLNSNDDIEKSAILNSWIYYLSSTPVVNLNEILEEESRYGYNANDLELHMAYIQYQAIKQLFDYEEPEEMHEWCEHAHFFLTTANSIRLSPFREAFLTKPSQAYAYFHWGSLYKQLSDEYESDIVKQEMTAAAVICFEKSLEIFDMKQYDLTFALVHEMLGELNGINNNAIGHLESALLIYTSVRFIDKWVEINTIIINIYITLNSKDCPENADLAIERLKTIITENEVIFEHNYLLAHWYKLLAKAYSIRVHGTQAENELNELNAFENELKYLDSTEYDLEHATLLMELCFRYGKGRNWSDMLDAEKCILYGESALAFFIAKHPKECGLLTYRLGLAYLYRKRGNRKQNIEKSISYLITAEQVYTREIDPEEWGTIKLHLGIAYGYRGIGQRQENTDLAIISYNNALKTIKENTFNCGLIYLNLSYQFLFKTDGDREMNLNLAIRHSGKASDTFRMIKDFDFWAKALLNLGTAFNNIRRGNYSENKEKAIIAFRAIIETDIAYTDRTIRPSAFWYLGSALIGRVVNDKLANQEMAIHLLKKSLGFFTKKTRLFEWAMIQANLGAVYCERLKGDADENIELGIFYLNQALSVKPRNKMFNKGRINLNLGKVYRERRHGDGNENFNKALTYMDAALQIFHPLETPDEYLQAAYNKGLTFYERKLYHQALASLEKGISAFENIRNNAWGSATKKEHVYIYKDLFYKLVECCLYEKEFEKAFKYACALKGRIMAESLVSQSADLNELSEKYPGFKTSWDEIKSLENQLDNEIYIQTLIKRSMFEGNNDEQSKLFLARSSKKINDLQTARSGKLKLLKDAYPFLTATINLEFISVDEAKAFAGKYCATIIEYFAYGDQWLAFVIDVDSFAVRFLPANTKLHITDALKLTLAYSQIVPGTLSSVKQRHVFHNLYRSLIDPVMEDLSSGRPLIIAPFQMLHNIPLGLAQDQNSRCLFEEFEIYYMSSSTIAIALDMQNTEDGQEYHPNNDSVCCICHSGFGSQVLHHLDEEIEAVKSAFYQEVTLKNDAALPNDIVQLINENKFSALHFSCHGSFNHVEPERSGLAVNGYLTVEKITSDLHLKNRPLVVLSSCQTGMSIIESGDEPTGLNQAFLQAGAGCIVSSLWSVNELSTMHLFKFFYQKKKQSGINDSLALRYAMKELKTMPKYESAYFWGAFKIYGLPELKSAYS